MLVTSNWCCGSMVDLLLEQDGTEAGIECAEAFLAGNLGHAADEACREGGLGHETDAGGFERAEGDVCEELGAGGGGEVDPGAVLRGGLVPEQGDGLLLEKFVAAELEGTLKEVADSGRAEPGHESTGTLVGDDLAHAADEAAVVGDWVELDARLDAVSTHMSAPCVLVTQHCCIMFCSCSSPYPFLRMGEAYTSTGVSAPWVTEQQTAPARAKREYRATPESFFGCKAASVFCFTASSFTLPVDDGGVLAVCEAIASVCDVVDGR